ncbi:MAG: hypothetical protein BMS9Abin05_1688 [Rhodothermia bacterium]|nr:MAG: hypothetical protein BMS9Abin05_1688 [Rhodothermia bacterium]
MKYVLDSSVYIQAQNQYYARDIVPGFWDTLLTLHSDDVVVSIDKVYDEIMAYHDVTERLESGPCRFVQQVCLQPPVLPRSSTCMGDYYLGSRLNRCIDHQH